MMSRDFRQAGPAMNPYQGMAGLHITFTLI
jgi:hypothetical protein